MSINNIGSWVRRQGSPITIGIIASLIVTALAFWTTSFRGLEHFALGTSWQSQPWTLLTYPWAYSPFYDGLAILFFVFLCMWMFFVGGLVERDLGSVKYLLLWLVMILLPALFIILLGPVVGNKAIVSGMFLPEAGITMVWCVRNPKYPIMLYGIVPVAGKWMGWITAGATILISGAGNPIFGVVCSLHLIVAVLYAANMIPFWAYSRGGSLVGKRKLSDSPYLKKHERMGKAYFDDVKKREKERDERERLRKMFESSIQDDEGGKEESR